MKFKSLLFKGILSLTVISLITSTIPAKISYADSFNVVTLGADLTDSQKSEMLNYFDVSANDVNLLEVTSKEEYEALSSVATSAQIGNKSISCSYIEPTSSGGLKIKTNNLTWVTEGMIKNALITAGIKNANVIAAAPFKVSGTAALTGIMKGFENSESGNKIDPEKKEAANEEIVVTGDLGDKIGQDDATNLINDIKNEVLKENPSSDEDVNEIVDKTINKYNYELSDEDKDKIKSLMTKINDLDINYNSIKDQLNDISNDLKDKIDTEAVKGFFDKVGEFFSSLWNSIKDFFTSDSDE
ncbi:MAG: DUF1002 domain-containing protein [Clostridiales bacterium]|nr:DUF1002 domain-containing protein [Clostridiales bacterium]